VRHARRRESSFRGAVFRRACSAAEPCTMLAHQSQQDSASAGSSAVFSGTELASRRLTTEMAALSPIRSARRPLSTSRTAMPSPKKKHGTQSAAAPVTAPTVDLTRCRLEDEQIAWLQGTLNSMNAPKWGSLSLFWGTRLRCAEENLHGVLMPCPITFRNERAQVAAGCKFNRPVGNQFGHVIGHFECRCR